MVEEKPFKRAIKQVIDMISLDCHLKFRSTNQQEGLRRYEPKIIVPRVELSVESETVRAIELSDYQSLSGSEYSYSPN